MTLHISLLEQMIKPLFDRKARSYEICEMISRWDRSEMAGIGYTFITWKETVDGNILEIYLKNISQTIEMCFFLDGSSKISVKKLKF